MVEKISKENIPYVIFWALGLIFAVMFGCVLITIMIIANG